jgi:hypothetical protein
MSLDAFFQGAETRVMLGEARRDTFEHPRTAEVQSIDVRQLGIGWVS